MNVTWMIGSKENIEIVEKIINKEKLSYEMIWVWIAVIGMVTAAFISILLLILSQEVNKDMAKKGVPAHDGRGKGKRAVRGRGGCSSTQRKGKGRK